MLNKIFNQNVVLTHELVPIFLCAWCFFDFHVSSECGCFFLGRIREWGSNLSRCNQSR